MQTGTVKLYNNLKGFGFITTASGEELFVHNSGLVDQIKPNDKVSFEVERGKKGLMAVNVIEPKGSGRQMLLINRVRHTNGSILAPSGPTP